MINNKILIGNHKWLFSLNKASQSICYESRLSVFYSVSNIRARFKRTHKKQLAMTFIKWANQFEVKPHFLLHQLSPGNKAYNHLLKPQSTVLRTKRKTIKQSAPQKAKQLLLAAAASQTAPPPPGGPEPRFPIERRSDRPARVPGCTRARTALGKLPGARWQHFMCTELRRTRSFLALLQMFQLLKEGPQHPGKSWPRGDTRSSWVAWGMSQTNPISCTRGKRFCSFHIQPWPLLP